MSSFEAIAIPAMQPGLHLVMPGLAPGIHAAAPRIGGGPSIRLRPSKSSASESMPPASRVTS